MKDLNLLKKNLCLGDKFSHQLTISDQEDLKNVLLKQAIEKVSAEDNTETYEAEIQRYYYESLATFMNEYPTVQIGLVLIKLDKSLYK